MIESPDGGSTIVPVAQHSAVRAAAVKNGKLAVEFHSQDARTSNASAVHALVAKACAGAQLAKA